MTSNISASHQKSYLIDLVQTNLDSKSCPMLTTFLYSERQNNNYKIAVYFDALKFKQLKPDITLQNIKFVPDYIPTKKDQATIVSNGETYATIRLKEQAGYASNYRLFKVLAVNLGIDLEAFKSIEIPVDESIDRELFVLLGPKIPNKTLEYLRSDFIKMLKALSR